MRDKSFRNILWWGVSSLLIFTPIARGAVRVWSIAPVLLAIYFLILLWLLRPVNPAIPVRIQSHLDLPIFLFLLLAAISFIFSIYKSDSFFALSCLFGYSGFFYLLLNSFEDARFKKLFGLVIIIASGLSLYGLLQYFGFFSHAWWMPEGFLAATYVNHNHFAGYLELAIPLALGGLFSGQSKGPRILLRAALTMMIAAFILTQSRAAWFFLGLSLLAMNVIFTKKRILRKNSLVIFLLTVAIIFTAFYLKENLLRSRVKTIGEAVVSKESREATFGSRVKMWQGALGLIGERPFLGVGIGDFDRGFYRYRPKGFNARAVYAHNEYLHMAAEMGMLAPLLMLWIFGSLILRGLDKKNSAWAIGAGAGILSLSLHGLIDFNFHIPANMLLFTVLAAYVARSNGGNQGG